MGQTGCEEAEDQGPWMGSCGSCPALASAHHGHTHDRKAGTTAGGGSSPGESCEGWWSRQGEVLRTGGVR